MKKKLEVKNISFLYLIAWNLAKPSYKQVNWITESETRDLYLASFIYTCKYNISIEKSKPKRLAVNNFMTSTSAHLQFLLETFVASNSQWSIWFLYNTWNFNDNYKTNLSLAIICRIPAALPIYQYQCIENLLQFRNSNLFVKNISTSIGYLPRKLS